MKVLLTTLHAKYVHSSLALPYLAAACADLPGVEFQILELTVNEQQDQLLFRLHDAQADVVLFSCYIWNTELTLRIVSDLKQLSPGALVVLGGPEVSFGAFDLMVRNQGVDCIVRGEGEEVCRELLPALRDGAPLDGIAGITYRDGEEIVANPERGAVAILDRIPSPFSAALVELSKPLVYYETSRGCPYSCAFCMSSIDSGVRSFSMERIRRDLTLLMESGVQTIKFVDRTFNYDARRANEIWRFILERNQRSRFHFEIAADLLTEENLLLLTEVPQGLFRFEIGVQSGGEETLESVGRKSTLQKVYDNVRRLKESTGVTVHLDLVAGLPGERMEGFLASLQRLLSMEPDHIQVETLKVMKGTPMRGIARKEQYAYSEFPPYKVLHNPWLTYGDIRRIDGISRLVEQIYNSGRFEATLSELGAATPLSEIFEAAARHFEAKGIVANLSLAALLEAVWDFAGARLEGAELERVREALTFDWLRTGYPGGSLPGFFEPQPELAGRRAPPDLPVGKPGERIRYYRRRFSRDYSSKPGTEGEVELTFIYRSAPGEGLGVELRRS